jgi:anti-sigma regulatory factor (Ser/Thr protein kinase)
VEVIPPRVPVGDRSSIGEVRRAAAALAAAAGFGEERAGRVAIVATELASNIVKHGTEGHCFLSIVEEAGESLVQIVAVDSGPGIADPASALRDGYSTAGTPGTGLGAVKRLSTSFDLASHADRGVVAAARIAAADRARLSAPAAPVLVGAVEAAHPGETVSGDGWAMEEMGGVVTLLLADGLGHGPLAAECARAAISAFRRHGGRSLVDRVQAIHEAMRGSRGAAIAVASIDPAAARVRYAGIGNISGRTWTESGGHNLVSMNGTAGVAARSIREFAYDFPSGALLVLHTDGVSARWALEGYPGLALRDPAVVAAVIHRDFARGRDDATVIVARSRVGDPHSGREERP